jgi:hypothetical protein
MNALPELGIQTVYKHWLNAASTLLACQWKLAEVQYETGLKIMQNALRTSPGRAEHAPAPAPAPAIEVKDLEQLAAERVSQGLAPPKEVYQVPYRSQIDWEKFPLWARPSDPEVFEGSCHEG